MKNNVAVQIFSLHCCWKSPAESWGINRYL